MVRLNRGSLSSVGKKQSLVSFMLVDSPPRLSLAWGILLTKRTSQRFLYLVQLIRILNGESQCILFRRGFKLFNIALEPARNTPEGDLIPQ